MAVSTDDLLALIPPMNAAQPRFRATVALSVDPLVRVAAAFDEMRSVDFDLDDAVGPQLDAVGVRVGLSRFVPYPLRGLFFSLGDPIRGLGQGVWKGPYDAGTSIYRLDDETYRRLLRAKVLANHWDGTIDGEAAIFDQYFTDPATLVVVSDDSYSAQPEEFFTLGDANRGLGRGQWIQPGQTANQPSLTSVDMKMTVGFAGRIPAVIDLAILDQGLIGAKPEGVRVAVAVTSVDGAPIFGLGLGNAYIAGLGVGALAVTPGDLIGTSAQMITPGTLDFTMPDNSDLLALL